MSDFLTIILADLMIELKHGITDFTKINFGLVKNLIIIFFMAINL